MINKPSERTDEVKTELLKLTASLFSGDLDQALLKVIRNAFPLLSTAFIINWIPEQGEDIYWVLIDEHRVAVIEISRESESNAESTPIATVSVANIRKRHLSAETRRKLDAALKLMHGKNASE